MKRPWQVFQTISRYIVKQIPLNYASEHWSTYRKLTVTQSPEAVIDAVVILATSII